MKEILFSELRATAGSRMARQLISLKRCFGNSACVGIVITPSKVDRCSTIAELVAKGHAPSDSEWVDKFLPNIPTVYEVAADDFVVRSWKYANDPFCPWDIARSEQLNAAARARQRRDNVLKEGGNMTPTEREVVTDMLEIISDKKATLDEKEMALATIREALGLFPRKDFDAGTLHSLINGRTITNVYEQPDGWLIKLSGRMELYVERGHLSDWENIRMIERRIPERVYSRKGNLKFITEKLMSIYHSSKEIENFNKWIQDKGILILGPYISDGTTGIYIHHYEEWLKEIGKL